MLNLYLFGAPRLERDGKPVAMDTRKALALMAYLAITHQSHSRDALATLLYPDADQSRARASLRRTLSALNAALEDNTLDIDRETIALAPRAKLRVDVIEFQCALDECKTHQHPGSEICNECNESLTRAADLYRDDFLAGFTLRDSSNFDDWQFFTAEHLRRQFANILEKLVRWHSANQAYEPAIGYARRWLALDPLHEPAHRQLMELYAQSNQRAAALRQYQECARVLEQELGVAPLAETTRLYEQIKEQRSGEEQGSKRVISPPLPSTAAPQQYPLVGRASELAEIQRAYASIRADGHLIVIEGETGIGKTRLAEEFLTHALEQGANVLTGRAYEGESNLAHGIFIEAFRALSERKDLRHKIPATWLGEVARLVPEIGTNPVLPPLDDPGARGRFFQGVRQTIFALTRGDTPGIFLLDNLQWADNASIDLLTFLVQRLRAQPLCIVAAWRTEDAAAIERLRLMATQAQRANALTTISLARLDSKAVTQLVTSTVGKGAVLSQKIGARLYRETEGLPFFVVEYLNALERGGTGAFDWSLPGGVRDLLRARLAGASETGRQLLSAAAVIGRSFDFDTLREASGRTEEETLKTLEELNARGLIKESPAETVRYDFAHEKLRELAYTETSAARRRLLHRRTAEGLVARGRARRETDLLANQIARHYRLAGETASAAEFYRMAGDHARTLYANGEAIAHFRAALALNHPDPAALHERIGDAQTLLGDYSGALASYASAASQGNPALLARIERKRASVHHRRGEYAVAENHFQIAWNTLIDNVPAAERAKLLADWSLTAHALAQDERAQEMATRALQLAESASDRRSLAQARNILGILARNRGDFRQARYQLEQSCAIAETLQNPGIHIAALNNLALVCRDRTELERAILLTQNALGLCVAMGDRHHEAALHNNLADLFHASGESEEAMAHLKQAVAIFAEVGADDGKLQPAIWQLVEW